MDNVFSSAFHLHGYKSFSQAILAFLPILFEIQLIIVQIEKMFKFYKEITKTKVLKYVIMNCSREFLVTQ